MSQLEKSYRRALKAAKKTKPKLPKRLGHLANLPFAEFVGRSPGGSDWVAYDKKKVGPMRRRLAQTRQRRGLPVRVTGLSDAQMGIVQDEMDMGKLDLRYGKSYVEGPADVLEDLAARVHDHLDDDHEDQIAGASLRDLTDAQIQFGVDNRIKSIKSLEKKIRRALP